MKAKIFKRMNSEEFYICFEGKANLPMFSKAGFASKEDAEEYLKGGRKRLKEIFEEEKKRRENSEFFVFGKFLKAIYGGKR